MRHSRWTVQVALVVLAAACAPAPGPLTNEEQAALADTVGRVASEYLASMAPKVDVARMLGLYEQSPDLVVAGEGMMWVGYDSVAKLARVEYPAGSSVTGTFDRKVFDVLSRDVVVFTSTFHAVMKDSAGREMPVQGALSFVFHRTPGGWKIALEHSSAPTPAH